MDRKLFGTIISMVKNDLTIEGEERLWAEAVGTAAVILNSLNRRTWNAGMVAARIAAAGGLPVDSLLPGPLVQLLEGGKVVVYKGMAYSLDVWE